MAPVVTLTNPIAKTLVAKIRDKATPSAAFRQASQQLGEYLIYSAAENLPTKSVEVETPLTSADVDVLADDAPVIVGIWRAGQVLVESALKVFPNAHVGYLGMFRDHDTHMPETYYENIPPFNDKQIFMVDPMLATGGSTVDALTKLTESGAEQAQIIVCCLIASAEGIENVQKAFPDVMIAAGTIDEKLNDDAYIVPGLGDAGDRLYNT